MMTCLKIICAVLLLPYYWRDICLSSCELLSKNECGGELREDEFLYHRGLHASEHRILIHHSYLQLPADSQNNMNSNMPNNPPLISISSPPFP